jgi:hypothetical protein
VTDGLAPTSADDPLRTLLLRCHAAELVPLARLLGVPFVNVGFATLAGRLARTLRRRGTHGVRNFFQPGAPGRPYTELLGDVAVRLGIDPVDDVAALELDVLRAHFAGEWARLAPAERARVWREMGLDGAPPEDATAAVTATRNAGRGVGYHLASFAGRFRGRGVPMGALLLTVTWCMPRIVTVPLFAWLAFRPDLDEVVAGVREVARLRQLVLHRITIGVVGSPSTGKDAGIRALFGIDSGNISPIAGSTRSVTITRLPGATALFVVNTPGLGDVVESVTEEARQVLDHIDVYVYVVNAEGGVQRRELDDYRRCVATGKPVLAVVNKVDVLRPRDRERYLADAREKLGAAAEDFLPVAFDPLPQLAPGPIGLGEVHAWLARRLVEAGKDPRELPPLPRPEPRDGDAADVAPP